MNTNYNAMITHQANLAGEISSKEETNRLVLAYLCYDTDAGNPLEHSGFEMATAHRHAPREEHRAYQKARGFNEDFAPDLEAVCHLDGFRAYWIKEAENSGEFWCWCDKTGRKADPDTAYYARRARTFWREAGLDGQCRSMSIWDFDLTTDAARKFWETGVSVDPYAVVLDCYDHGGQVWSISGSGMQCRWDTARGAGVLIPDEEIRALIDERKFAYAFGDIQQRGNRWFVYRDYSFGFTQDPEFDSWSDAWEYLCAFAKKHAEHRTPAMESEGFYRSCNALVKGVIEEYNQWLAGDCYATVVESFRRTDDDSWSLENEESCWGYVGEEYARSQLQQLMASI